MPDLILMSEAFAAAGVLALAVTLLLGRSPRADVAAAGAAPAVLIAAYAGWWVLGLLPRVPPRESADWLLVAVLPAAAVAEMIAAASARVGWAARVAVAALAVPVLLRGSVYVTDLAGPGSREWSPGQTWLTYVALAAALLTAWAALERLAARTRGVTALACVTGAVLGAGVVLMLSGYATGGPLGLPLAAALGAAAVAALAGKAEASATGAIGVGVVGLFALLVVGRLFAGLSDLNAALLFAAPLFAWLPEALPERPRLRAALRLGLTAAAVLIALVLAQQKFAADSARPGVAAEPSVEDYMNFGK